jgi:hypothetical protein
MLFVEEERPPGLKPALVSEGFRGDLKGRSSTVIHELVSSSAAC